MALIAAHLNKGVIVVVIYSVAIGMYSPSSPTSIPSSPILPVPNKPYGFCGRLSTLFIYLPVLCLREADPSQSAVTYRLYYYY